MNVTLYRITKDSYKMKTKTIALLNRYLIIAVLLLLWTNGSYSQQVIKFKNGQEYKVYIVYQTKDTLKYHLPSESDVIRTVLMDQVESIRMEAPFVSSVQDTTFTLMKDKTYLHYRHNTNTGIGLSAGGAVVAVVGIVVLTSAQFKEADWGFSYFSEKFSGAILTGLGGALLLTGAILAITSSINMQDYKNKLHGFSFDVKYTPGLKGISLVYRF
jgi:predicted phage tail protein